MKYWGIEKSSFVNGEGIRVVLWVAGCEHHCKNCHNQFTWSPYNGELFTMDTLDLLTECVQKPYIDGLTLSGGDPMHSLNRKMVKDIASYIKLHTGKTIWLYTGYRFEDIQNEPILNYVDVIVDGKYIEELHDDNYLWAGSTNQRIWRKVDNKWQTT